MSTGSQKFMEIALGVLAILGVLLLSALLWTTAYTLFHPAPQVVVPRGQIHCECYQRGGGNAIK